MNDNPRNCLDYTWNFTLVICLAFLALDFFIESPEDFRKRIKNELIQNETLLFRKPGLSLWETSNAGTFAILLEGKRSLKSVRITYDTELLEALKVHYAGQVAHGFYLPLQLPSQITNEYTALTFKITTIHRDRFSTAETEEVHISKYRP